MYLVPTDLVNTFFTSERGKPLENLYITAKSGQKFWVPKGP